MRKFVVVPTCRKEQMLEFVDAWKGQIDIHAELIVVEDAPTQSFEVEAFRHLAWDSIDNELGDDAWIIPRQTDCVRSIGYYRAYTEGCDMVITMDDDVRPNPENNGCEIAWHVKAITQPTRRNRWQSTLSDGMYPRGFPYQNRCDVVPTAINHGGWSGVLDLDAMTQLHYDRRPGLDQLSECYSGAIEYGQYFPMCGMNLAFTAEMIPAMYFLLMGGEYRYDRFGDIWCGLFAKKICDVKGWGVKTGNPVVQHARASNVWKNLAKEASGYAVNEALWEEVDKVVLRRDWSVARCYRIMSDQMRLQDQGYWHKTSIAMRIWADLFGGE